MKAYSHIKRTRREFIREKRRSLKKAKKALNELRLGCACKDIFDGTFAFEKAVIQMQVALDKMNKITKPLA